MYRNFVRNSTSWYKIYVGFYVKFEFTRLALGRFAEIVIRDWFESIMAIRIHHRGMANTLWTYIRPQTVWTRTLSNAKE